MPWIGTLFVLVLVIWVCRKTLFKEELAAIRALSNVSEAIPSALRLEVVKVRLGLEKAKGWGLGITETVAFMLFLLWGKQLDLPKKSLEKIAPICSDYFFSPLILLM